MVPKSDACIPLESETSDFCCALWEHEVVQISRQMTVATLSLTAQKSQICWAIACNISSSSSQPQSWNIRMFLRCHVCIGLANKNQKCDLFNHMYGWMIIEVAVFICEVWLIMNYALWYEKLTSGLSNGAFTALKWQFDDLTLVNVLLILLGESILTELLVFLGTANVMMRIPLDLASFLAYTAGSFELTVVINVHVQENTLYFPLVLKPYFFLFFYYLLWCMLLNDMDTYLYCTLV